MTRPRRQEREIAQTRLHILEAAAEVFAKKGYTAASVQEVAHAAGYTAPSLYSYFTGKRAILDGLLDMIIEESDQIYQLSFPQGLTLRQKLELLIRHQHAWITRRKDLFLFFIQKGLPALSSSKRYTFDLKQRCIDQLIAWFTEHASTQELGQHNATSAALAYWGITHTFFLYWLRNPSPCFEDIIPQMLDFLFHGLEGPIELPKERYATA